MLRQIVELHPELYRRHLPDLIQDITGEIGRLSEVTKRYASDNAAMVGTIRSQRQMLEDAGRVAFRYCDAEGNVTAEANPNGAQRNIAGILNEGRNVLGMMPHPERACDPLLGGEDGNAIWRSILEAVGARA